MSLLNPIEKTYRELLAQGQKVIRLFSGNPTEEGFQFPPAILEEAYRLSFTKIYSPHPKGLKQAREAIAEYYLRDKIQINPENILLTSGTSESFFYLFSLLVRPGDNILTPNPSYPLFDYIASLAHVEMKHYPLIETRGWQIDIEALKNKIDSKTRAIVLVSPHNPTGSVASAHQVQELVDLANARQIPLICDEVFSEFYFPFTPSSDEEGGRGRLNPSVKPLLTSPSSEGEGINRFPRPIAIAKPHLCFTLNGISKMFALPAYKLSWIVVSGESKKVEEAIDRLETTADTFLSCHIPIQEALPRLFEKGWSFVEAYKKEVGERRALALEILQKNSQIEFVKPEGAFYLMFKLKSSSRFSSEEDFVIQLMKEKNVFVHPGYFYDYEDGIHGVISFLCEREKLKTGLEYLMDFIKK